jgi:hypothetical protein
MRHAALLALLLLGACSVPRTVPDGANEGAIFPHPEGFDGSGEHGQRFLGEDAARCVLCHDPDGGDVSGAPGCRTCHASFPHGADWLGEHGPAWQDLDTRSDCAPCHGEQLDGGNAGVACDSCHAAWPHPAGWRGGSTHAAFVGERGTVDACLGCHEAEALGADAEPPGCGDCHALYPHPEGWSAGAEHGATWIDGDCGTCHGREQQGGALAPACASCHPAYPHPEGWRAEHPAHVAPAGAGPCLLCHDPGDGPDDLPVSCAATCHGVAP